MYHKRKCLPIRAELKKKQEYRTILFVSNENEYKYKCMYMLLKNIKGLTINLCLNYGMILILFPHLVIGFHM